MNSLKKIATVFIYFLLFPIHGANAQDVNWVAVGQGTNSIATSTDGNSWIGRGENVFYKGYDVEWNGSMWVAVGSYSNTIAYSIDGINWTGLGSNIFSGGGFGVAWNGSIWVAVGQGSNSIAYSIDGISWTGIGTSVFDYCGYGITWNGSIWVAVGRGTNTIAYSTDGINWTGLGSNIFSYWGKNIAWNGSMWVASGYGTNSIATSNDGINWTGRGVTNIFYNCNSAAWNGSMWVAVGSGTSTIATSVDGINWTGLGSIIFSTGMGIIWDGSNWIAVGNGDNTMASSIDGITWTSLGNNTFSSIGMNVFSKSLLVDDITPPIINCLSTQEIGKPNDSYTVVPNFLNEIIVIDNITSTENIQITQDPVAGTIVNDTATVTITAIDEANNTSDCSFTIIFLPDTIPPSLTCPSNQNILAECGLLAYLPNYSAMAVVSDNLSLTNSITITQYPEPGTAISGTQTITLTATDQAGNSSDCSFEVAVSRSSAKNWIALGEDVNHYNYIAYSDNGEDWNAVQSNIVGTVLTAGWSGTMWIIGGGYGTNTLATSTDGINWIGRGKSVFSYSCNSLKWNGSMWIAAGYGINSIATSTDGINWTGRDLSNIFTSCLDVEWNGTMWLAAGYGSNSLAYSYDGINWSGLGNSIFSSNANCIKWNGTIWLALGAGGNTIATSTDGINWTGQGTSVFSTGGISAEWNGSMWVAVGQGPNNLASSADGVNWTGTGLSIFSIRGIDIEWSGKKWIAVGEGLNSIATSEDGINWTGQGLNTFSNYGRSIAVRHEIDIEPPVLTCLENQVLLSQNGETATLPDYRSGLSVTDDITFVENIILTQTPSPDTIFSGSQLVTIIATDEAGNSKECLFTVTIPPLSGGKITPATLTIQEGSFPGILTNVESASGGTGTYTYWWIYTTDGYNWIGIPDTGNESFNPTALNQTTWFKRSVSDGINTAFSNYVKITVPLFGGTICSTKNTVWFDDLIEIDPTLNYSQNFDINEGKCASGGSTTYYYQWQYSEDNGITWINLEGKTDINYNNNLMLTKETWFRRKTIDNAGEVGYSNTSIIHTMSPGRFSPWDAISFNSATFNGRSYPGTYTNQVSASGGVGEIKYQWEWADYPDEGCSFEFEDIPGATEDSLICPVISKTKCIRRKAIDSEGFVVWSPYGKITINPGIWPLNPGTITPSEQIINLGETPSPLTNSISVTGGNSEYDLSYEWYKSTDEGITWEHIYLANDESYSPPSLTLPTWYKRSVFTLGSTSVEFSNISKVQLANTVPLDGGIIAFPRYTVFDIGEECTGSITCTGAGGGAGGYQYQWQRSEDAGENWIDIEGETSRFCPIPTMYVSTWFRRKVTDISGDVEYSNASIFIITPPFNGAYINSGNGIVQAGTFIDVGAASATGGLGNFRYSWEYSTDNINFYPIANSDSLVLEYRPIGAMTQTTWFKIITYEIGSSRIRYSNTCQEIVYNPNVLSGGIISPDSLKINSGTSPGTIFSVMNASGGTENYLYQWQNSTNSGSTWNSIPGSNQTNYTVPNLTQTTYFRRKVDDGQNIEYSNISIIDVIIIYPLTGGTIGASTTAVDYGKSPGIIWNAALPTEGTGGFRYQWVSSVNNGSTWDTIVGATREYYPVPALIQSTKYRRLVTDNSNSTAFSNSVDITVNPLLSLFGGTIVAEKLVVFPGTSDASISNELSVTGGIAPYSYQWQILSGSSSTWDSIPGATAIDYSLPVLYQTSTYRRIVKDSNNTTAYSNSVTINIFLSAGSVSPTSFTINPGTSPGAISNNESASGGYGTLTYTWQRSINNGNDWMDIEETNSLSYTPPELYQTTWFRRKVTDSVLSCEYTEPVIVNVLLTGGEISPSEVYITGGTEAEIISNAALPQGGDGIYKYKWLKSEDLGSSWQIVDGAEEKYLLPGILSQETWFIRRTSDKNNESADSNISKIKMALSGGKISLSSYTIVSGTSPGTITGTADAAYGTGVYSYQWQVSTDNTLTWTNISGAAGTSYSAPQLSQKTWYRRRVTDSNGEIAYSNISYIKILPPISNSTSYIELPNPSTAIDTGLPVGAIAGQADVSPSGAATYQVPITIPPGSAGMQPEISVVYNSQSGDGLLGVGFNISGLSAITRVPQDIYHDGAAGSIGFDSGDRFALDGVRLVTLGSYGGNGTVYYPESDNTMRITSFGESGYNGIKYFQVETKDGKIIEYGKTSDSRIMASDNTVIAWKINKVTDRNKNYIIYAYNEFDDEKPISEISYTGNSIEGTTPYNSINFEYQNKTDVKKHYIKGSLITNDLLLKSISVESESCIVRKYDFEYSFDIKSHLSKIVETGSDGIALNPTIIEWGHNNAFEITPRDQSFSDIYQPESGYELVADQYYYTAFDVNSDGLTDLIKVFCDINSTDGTHRNHIQIWQGEIENSDGYFYLNYGPVWLMESDVPSDFSAKKLIQKGLRFGDLYGDGSVDYITPKYLGGGSENYIRFVLENSNKYDIENKIAIEAELVYGTDVPLFIIEDFNKNGRDEILFIETIGQSNHYYGKLIEDREVKHLFDFTLDNEPQDIFSGDYNSDGLVDIRVVTKSNIYTFMNGSGLIKENPSLEAPILNVHYYTSRQGDFNDDGLLDLLISGQNKENLIVAYGNPNGSVTLKSFPSILGVEDEDTNKDDDKDNIIVVDFNNDGYDDFILFNAEYNKTWLPWGPFKFVRQTVSWYKSTGTNFELVKTSISTEENANLCKETLVGDFNGDGRTDIMKFGKNFFSETPDESLDNWKFYNSPNKRTEEHKVVCVTNGFKQKTEFSFRPLSHGLYTVPREESNFYLNNHYSSNNINCIQPSLPVVSTISTPDGIGGTSVTSYKYEDAKFHIQGKGFLGFRKIISENSTLKRKLTKTYRINTTFYDPYLEETLITTDSDSPISSVVVSPSYEGLGNKQFTVSSSSSTSTDHLKNVVVTSNYTFDDHGNPTNILVNYSGDGTITTVNSYIPTASWCDSRLDISTVTKQIGTESSSHVYKNNYDDLGRLTSKISDYQMEKALTESFSNFDSWGNPQTVKVQTEGKQRITTFKYDNLGRFIEKETNALGHSKKYTYDGRFGVVLSEKTPDGLLTSYEYDGFGRKKKSNLPDGRTAETTYSWLLNPPLVNSVYSITNTLTGEPTSTVYCDAFGRELRAALPSFSGLTYSDKEYNADGSLSRESLPYFANDGNSTAKWTTYLYNDPYGRLKSQTFNSQTTSFDYTIENGKYKQTITNPANQSSSKVFDAMGNVTKATDEGGDIDYEYYPSGQVKKITSNGAVFEMHYDDYDRQDYLIDPDAGRIDYRYNAFGELEWQKDAKGNEYEMKYDELGRLDTKNCDGIVTDYEYITDIGTYGLGRLSEVMIASDHVATSYSYDALGRITKQKEVVRDQTFETDYTYNTQGKLKDLIYPSQNGERFKVMHEYDTNGYLKKVTKADGTSIWELDETNALGQVEQYKLGAALTTTKAYDSYGLPDYTQTNNSMGTIQHNDYLFDAATGNLIERKDVNRSLTESFAYDNLNRLKTISVNNNLKLALNYLDNGNIDTISSIGKFYYHPIKKHAVTGIDNRTGIVPNVEDTITYTTFNKVALIREPDATNQLEFLYGVDQQRRRTVYTNNGQQKTTWFIGNYEKETSGSTTREFHYISGGDGLAAVYIKTNGTGVLYYILKDHLGSIQYICNESGQKLEELSFDAWGRRRNPVDWTYDNVPSPQYLTRGFTGHEHLDAFGLINMNGRVYDPLLGRMLSPDPYLQMPDFTQNLNRYSYCLNNPLKFTDPSGYKWKWKWINPLHWFSEGMQWINDHTVKLRQKMADVGIPDFSVGTSINGAGDINFKGSVTGHEVFNTANVYRDNARQVVEREIAEVNQVYGPAWRAASGDGYNNMFDAFSWGATFCFSEPLPNFLNKKSSIDRGGYGISFGRFTGTKTRGIYITTMKGEGFMLGASLDFTYYDNKIGKNLELDRIKGYGSMIDFGVWKGGYALSSDGYSALNQTPTYRAHTISLGMGLDVGYTNWTTKTYVIPTVPWIGLLIPKY